ncbi:M24 family metallopeptidase [Streptomyces sp. NBC_01089]|uniref:M24 family metallopeptidase n=1 Tax=Streptomyces sp. NBC_01089 TaxID=2903747 RepID=UPI0038666264|nr:Xaa-Pro peptidase family protein [Streptomyces sp. NBC_01089]
MPSHSIASPGAVLGVDWEERVNFDRLRSERLARAMRALETSDLGALVLFDMNNIRYTTATHIGNWARDKLFRCVLLMRGHSPILWDIGSAARQHKTHASWLPADNWRAGISSWRGSIPEDVGVEAGNAKRIADLLRENGLHDEPVGIDVVEIPVLRALEREGLHVVNGQELMQQARRIKTVDEIALLDHSAAMVDAAYDELYRSLHVGMRENDCVALVNKVLYELGSEEVEAVNAISGERCSPHPHVFSDRITRPGDTAYFDIIHSFNGYRTCYYRTLNVGSSNARQRDAYQRARDAIDQAISAVRPGATTADVARALPSAADLGYASEEEAFGLQYCHGIGLSVWEQPLISRYHSLEHPVPVEEGMVFALETYWPTKDGSSAARIEEEVVVTADGPRVITRFPADELLVAGTRYWNGFSFAVDRADRAGRGAASYAGRSGDTDGTE